MKQFFTLIVLGIFAAAPGFSESISVDFTSPSFSTAPGGTVDFQGSLSNVTGDTQFLNGANATFDLGTATIDLTPFFNGPLSLAGGESSGNIDLFTILFPADAPTGHYNGVFTILGGSDEFAQELIASADFAVDVRAAVATPEPATVELALAALCTIGFARRRRATQFE